MKYSAISGTCINFNLKFLVFTSNYTVQSLFKPTFCQINLCQIHLIRRKEFRNKISIA